MRFHSLNRKTFHLSTESLARSISGELNFLSAWFVRRHIERCWHCRSLLDAVTRPTIELAAYSRLLAGPQPANGREQLRRRLLTQEAELAAARLAPASKSRTLFWSAALSTIALGSLAFVTILAHHPAGQTLSVTAFMKEASAQESGRIEGDGVHRVIAFEEQNDAGRVLSHRTVEVWSGRNMSAKRLFKEGHVLERGLWERDGQSAVRREFPKPGSGTRSRDAGESHGRLGKEELWANVPSVKTFEDLTSTTSGACSVQPSSGDYVVSCGSRYRGDVAGQRRPHLIEATLTLRHSDLRATGETLRIADRGQINRYRFQEIAWETISNETLTANTKVDREEFEPSLVAGQALSGSALAIHVMDRLDITGLLGEYNLSIRSGDKGEVKLSGTLPAAELPKLNKTLSGLRGSEGFHNEVVSAITHADSTGVQSASLPTVVDGSMGEGLRSLYAMRSGLTGKELDEAVAEFSTNLSEESSDALAQAAAIRSIVRAINPSQLQALSYADQTLYFNMLQRHLIPFKRDMSALRAQISASISLSQMPSVEIADPGDLNSIADSLMSASAEIDRAITQSISASVSPGGQDVLPLLRPSVLHQLAISIALAESLQGHSK